MKYLKINNVSYEGEFKVKLTFNDGVIVTVDIGSWIRRNPHPQYDRYLNESVFKDFYIDAMGNIAWGKNRDLYFPIDQLHDGNIMS